MEPAVALLRDMVKIKSPSRYEESITAFLAAWMEERGFEDITVDPTGNVYGAVGQGKHTILLAGHLDTVPGELPVVVKDGRVYGRGSVDAKGSMATFLMAAAESMDTKNLRIVVLGTIEEELYSEGVRGFLRDYKGKIDYIVTGEPNFWDRINIGYKGCVTLDYELKKPITHAASPESTAIEDVLRFAHIMRKWVEQYNLGREKVFDQLLLSIRSISSWDNGVEESVRSEMNFRTPPGFSFEKLEEQVDALRNKATVRYLGKEHAVRSDKKSPLVKAFLQAIRSERGNPRFVVKTGTSDMNAFAELLPNTPIVTYGPGDSNLDHTPGEFLNIEEYAKAITVVKKMLKNLETMNVES